MKTIFEKIIDREIPADIIYESDKSLAFLDIQPVEKGHILLISKKPYPWMTDVPQNEIAEIFIEAQKIMQIIKQTLPCDYVQLGVVGKDVPHFHIHLIPRYLEISEEDSGMRKHTPYENSEEKNSFVEKIKNAF